MSRRTLLRPACQKANLRLTCEAGRTRKAQRNAPVKCLACFGAVDACKSLQQGFCLAFFLFSTTGLLEAAVYHSDSAVDESIICNTTDVVDCHVI